MSAEDDEALAMEMATGLLAAEALTRAEARMDREPDLARAVRAARDRLLPLDLAVAAVAPLAGLWDGIAGRIASLPAVATLPEASPEAALPGPAPANADRPPCRWLRVAAALAASLLLALSLAWGLRGSEGPLAVAVLQVDDGTVLALVEDFGAGRARLRPLAAVVTGPEETLQVWTKWSEEDGPVSLGLLAGFETTALDPPARPDPVAGQLYEITREPPGGSPTGLPTGPILAMGLAVAP